MLEAAQQAAEECGQTNHHFRVLQLPMNLFESGALLTPNTGAENQQTVLELAQQENISILVNRPFNAIPKKQGGMIRLADPRAEQTRHDIRRAASESPDPGGRIRQRHRPARPPFG